MASGNYWTTTLLGIAITATALGIVYSRHESRKLFTQLDVISQERDKMNVEWGKLLLEESTWAAHSRIESLAQKEFHMHIPNVNEVIVLKP